MKISKKISLGLVLIVAVLGLALLRNPSSARAETTFLAQSQADITGMLPTLAFQDRATITGTIGGQKIEFVDPDITDGTYNYKPPAGTFCSSGKTVNGITLNGSPFAAGATKVTANVDLDYSPDGTAAGCKDTSPNSIKNVAIGSPGSRLTTFQWNVNDLIELTSGATFSHTGNASLFEKDINTKCGDIVILASGSTGSGTEYMLTTEKFGVGGVPLKKLNDPNFSGDCNILSSRVIGISGTKGVAAPVDTTAGGPPAGTSCIDDKSLDWMVCPVLNGISKSADGIEKFVASQLNFSVEDNLNDSVHKAWTIFRTLTTVIIVIVMLIMVFSQAIGGGPFDAYTVRKILPKLVAAIILMQISWTMCEYLIKFSNDAGQAIGNLMAAPFGGPAKLELGQLLQHWSGGGAIVAGAASTTGFIGAIVLTGVILTWGWPILVLAVLLVFIAVIVALATLLIRNALIVLLVMTAPLAFIAFVLPGADRFWKMWKDNLVRVLVFFPLVIGLIYGGRIFAWIVGGLGTPGPLDLIMILAGFFGPYFFLPKTFKWAGPGVAAAANAINNSFPVKKGREVASRELLARQRDKQKELVDKYYSSLVFDKQGREGKNAAKSARLKAGLRRGLIRTAGGRPIPTKRQTMRMLQEAGKWKEEEIALEEGKINNDYKEFQKSGMSVQEAKEAVRNKHYDPTGKHALTNRAFFTWAYDTKSFLEMGEKDWRTGANDPKGPYEDMFKTQGWIDFMHGNSNAYGDFSSRLGASAVPYRLPLGGGPKIEDYQTGGKRYNILDYENAVEQNKDGTVKMDANNQPIYIKDPEDNLVPNIHYNPGLKRLIDAKDSRVPRLLELQSDSERFTKLIDQAEDPSAVVAQRPEEFKYLKQISAELEAAGVQSVGKLSLKSFIDKESLTLGGRNILQRLTGAAGPEIDAMLGKNYIQNAITIRGSGDAAQMGYVEPAASQNQPVQNQATHQNQATGTVVRPAGQTTAGQVRISSDEVGGTPGAAAPLEIKIDHGQLANAIGEQVGEQFRAALKEAGLHRNQGSGGGQESGLPGDQGEQGGDGHDQNT